MAVNWMMNTVVSGRMRGLDILVKNISEKCMEKRNRLIPFTYLEKAHDMSWIVAVGKGGVQGWLLDTFKTF